LAITLVIAAAVYGVSRAP